MTSHTIKQQFSIITATVTSIVVGVVLVVAIAIIHFDVTKQAERTALVAGAVVAANIIESTDEISKKTSQRLLDSLAADDDIVWAEVQYDRRILAVLERANAEFFKPSATESLEHKVKNSAYTRSIETPIIDKGERVGKVLIWLNLWPYYMQIFTAVALSVIALLLGGAGAYWFSGELHERVIQPLRQLSRLMVRVSSAEDYAARFNYFEENEIGALGRSFNQMLSQIQDHENNLKKVIRELEHARDAAEDAARSKSSFLANMSHEIRTPMNGVVGMTSLLKRTELTKQQRLYFDTIEKSASSLLMIIDDILDFTKIEAGRLEMRSEPFSLVDNLNSIRAFFESPTKNKGIEFQVTYPPSIPQNIQGDSGRLRQILLNLIGNAVKFTEKGRVELAVTVTGPRGSQFIHFAVSDTGIGISESSQNKIFSEFFQADDTATRQFGGTGLGLAICKQLVSLMGGTIGFESQEGLGSTFWFEIPVREVEVEKSSGAVRRPTKGIANPFARAIASNKDRQEMLSEIEDLIPETTAKVQGEPAVTEEDIELAKMKFEGKVLVAEDSEVNQFIIKEFLTTLGLDPKIVANGQEALEEFEAEPYDLILMDVQMPVMDGAEATKRICELQKTQGIHRECKIVGLSAHAMSGDRERYLEVGMSDYLTKPIEMGALASMLSKFLRQVNQMNYWR